MHHHDLLMISTLVQICSGDLLYMARHVIKFSIVDPIQQVAEGGGVHDMEPAGSRQKIATHVHSISKDVFLARDLYSLLRIDVFSKEL